MCTKCYQNWSMSVKDIASQSSVIFEHDYENTYFGRFMIPKVMQIH